jgi:O-antigen ligase
MAAMHQLAPSPEPSAAATPSSSTRWKPLAVAFVIAGAVVLAVALPGGTFDPVLREEYGIVIWTILGIGYAIGLLPRAMPGRASLVLMGVLLVYGAWTALSLGWTESSERTTLEITRVLDYLALAALIASVLDRRTWRAAALGIGFGALVVCVLSVTSRLAPGAFPTPTLYQPAGQNRLSDPFGYWNALGAWSAMSCAIGLAIASHDRSRWRRAVALGLVPIAGLAAYLSYSRSTIGGIVVAGVVVLLSSRARFAVLLNLIAAAAGSAILILAVRGEPDIANGTGNHGAGAVVGALVLSVVLAGAAAALTRARLVDRARLPRQTGRAVTVGAVALLVLVAAVLGPGIARRAWSQFRHPTVATTADPASRVTQLSGIRYDVWTSALQSFEKHPIEGIGSGTFEFWWNRQGKSGEFVRNAHSLELENMAELGAPGLLLIVAVLGAATWVLLVARIQSRRTATAGAAAALLGAFLVYVVQASVDWMWQSTAVTVLAIAAAAVAGARLSTRSQRLRWFWRLGIALAAIGAVAVQIPSLLSTSEIRRSQTAERGRHPAFALAWANAAAGVEPWSASAYEQRALVLESAGLLNKAAQDLRRAISYEQTNFRHRLLLARVETERGRLAAAVAAYRQARRLRPKAAVFQYAPLFSAVPTRR